MRTSVVPFAAPIRREALLAWAPFGALAIAAVERPLRIPVLAILIVAYVMARRRDGNAGGILMSALPIGLVLAAGAPLTPSAQAGGLDCANPMSPAAAWRAFEAVAVVALVIVLTRSTGRSLGELGWRRPGRRLAVISLGVLVVGGSALVALGEVLARPFFGDFTFALDGSLFIVPALVFAVSNAVAEETAYRGAVYGWLGPGLLPAVASAVVFGLAHTGPDFVSSPAPVVAAMIATSLVAWVVLRRTGSLALLIAAHAAADIPLYLYMACSTG